MIIARMSSASRVTSAHLGEDREEIRIAPGERAAQQLAHPVVQRERDRAPASQDQQRDQRIGQPGEQVLDAWSGRLWIESMRP